MRSKLVLTLWLVGAVLYAGSTAFLAHAILGVGSSAAPADKAKAATVARTASTPSARRIASPQAKPSQPRSLRQTAKTAAIA
jgi:hypothetical protein